MKIYLAVIVLFVCSSCFASDNLNPIDGSYKCNGSEYDKKNAFKCDFKIAKTGQTYGTKARCDDGTSYIGTGIYERDKHRLALVFTNPKNSEETGVNIVDIHADGSMTLAWTYLNKTTFGYIRCVKNT